jgi:hypothetical protein
VTSHLVPPEIGAGGASPAADDSGPLLQNDTAVLVFGPPSWLQPPYDAADQLLFAVSAP